MLSVETKNNIFYDTLKNHDAKSIEGFVINFNYHYVIKHGKIEVHRWFIILAAFFALSNAFCLYVSVLVISFPSIYGLQTEECCNNRSCFKEKNFNHVNNNCSWCTRHKFALKKHQIKKGFMQEYNSRNIYCMQNKNIFLKNGFRKCDNNNISYLNGDECVQKTYINYKDVNQVLSHTELDFDENQISKKLY